MICFLLTATRGNPSYFDGEVNVQTLVRSGSLLAFFGVTPARLLRLMGLDASAK